MNANTTGDTPQPSGRAGDPIADIRAGLPVYTVDGEQLGTVKELDGNGFKVDAPLRPDYWLRRADVLSFTAERVTMKFNAGATGGHHAGR